MARALDLPLALPIIEHIVFSGDARKVHNLCEVLTKFNISVSDYI